MSPEQAAGDRRSTPGPTSTAWARCSTRCWRASRRSPEPRPRRCSPSGSAARCPGCATCGPACPESVEQAVTRALATGARRPVRQRGRVRPGIAADRHPPTPRPRCCTAPLTAASARRPRPATDAGGRNGHWSSASSSAWACCSPGGGHPGGGRRERGGQSASPCSRSRTWATRPTPISPTAWPTSCARKLSPVPGSQVIARGSSNQYRGTTKTPQQIARELGVEYLLTATVRWEKARAAPSRVRVTPGAGGRAPGQRRTTRWQQPFDAAMTDVFQVQADIAGAGGPGAGRGAGG